MKRVGMIAILALVAVTWASAQDAGKGSVQDIEAAKILYKLERAWMEAYVNRDISFLERYLSDDYAGTDPDGTVRDKKGEIEAMKLATVALAEMKPIEIMVRTYGDAAVITGRSIIEAKVNGQDVSGQYRFTDVWIKQGDRWQAVASQVNRIAKP